MSSNNTPAGLAAQKALDVSDWRRRVFALYQSVRDTKDPSVAHALWRRGRDDLFASHPSSPLTAAERAAFTGLPIAPYDPAWRFDVPLLQAPAEADGEAEPEPRSFEFATGTDGVVPFERIGTVDVPLGIGRLDVWRLKSYGGGIFLPVRDALAAREGGTYGGGRYLLDMVKGADLGSGGGGGGGAENYPSLILDFNFAYNPSCAYDPAWACPLAPPGNRVGVEIPVGERYGGYAH